jgi:hypothetical protein
MISKGRRYKVASMQRIYDAMREAAKNPASEIYLADGSQHRGAMHRCAFWDGFNGMKRSPHAAPGTLSQACFMAGRDFKAELDKSIEKGKK